MGENDVWRIFWSNVSEKIKGIQIIRCNHFWSLVAHFDNISCEL